MQTTEAKPAELARKLLKWFRTRARDLPWRRTSDPYAIWVSEIMLQQTQVKTVIPYWERWMRELPDVGSLAKASPAKIHKLWEGLGYYTRVRNMQKAAGQILALHHGIFPQRHEEVLALPGVGRYTAGAICSLAFGQATPILDGNVIRVLSRVFAVGGDPKEKRVAERLWQLAEAVVLVAEREPVCALHFGPVIPACSALNQSLMELGATVCVPKEPRCGECPLSERCRAYQQKRTHLHPALPARMVTTPRRFAAFFVRDHSRVLAVQRPGGVINAHLWELPNVELGMGETDIQSAAKELLGAAPEGLRLAVTVRHSITRYRIRLEVYETRVAQVKPSAAQWLSLRQLSRKAFTSAHRKALDRLTG